MTTLKAQMKFCKQPQKAKYLTLYSCKSQDLHLSRCFKGIATVVTYFILLVKNVLVMKISQNDQERKIIRSKLDFFSERMHDLSSYYPSKGLFKKGGYKQRLRLLH